jgi:hypothetical protein
LWNVIHLFPVIPHKSFVEIVETSLMIAPPLVIVALRVAEATAACIL